MADIEKVIAGLACCGKGRCQMQECPYYRSPYPRVSQIDCETRLKRDALELLEARQPRVLSLEELKQISAANYEIYADENTEFVWMEDHEEGFGVSIAKPTYSFHPEWGNDFDSESFYVYYMGTDVGVSYFPKDYSRTWRCWSEKPSAEMREAVPWASD